MKEEIRPVIVIRSLIHNMAEANVVDNEKLANGAAIQMIVGHTLIKERSNTKETAVEETLKISILIGSTKAATGTPITREMNWDAKNKDIKSDAFWTGKLR